MRDGLREHESISSLTKWHKYYTMFDVYTYNILPSFLLTLGAPIVYKYVIRMMNRVNTHKMEAW